MSDLPSTTTAIIVDKDGGLLGASETFLRAHIERLPHRTIALLGNPGTRRLHPSGAYLQSRHVVSRGSRWLLDRVGVYSNARFDSSAVERFLRSQGVNVVLAEYGPTALSIMGACRRAGVAMVTHFHGWDAYVLASDQVAYRELWDNSTAIVAVSRHMQRHLVDLGAPADRVIWNPCGAEPDPTPADPESAAPIFVTIGRPTPKKATAVVLLAFAEVLSHVPDARLELLGAHPDSSTLQLIQALGAQHAITFHGPQPHERILTLLRSARCYVHPSVTAPDGDREGTPVSVLEAMAAGLPVVSTLHGGIPDVLGKGGGTLVEEFDVAATATSMRAYAEDASLAARDGRIGRAQLESRWAMKHSIARLADVLSAAGRRDFATIRQLSLNGVSD